MQAKQLGQQWIKMAGIESTRESISYADTAALSGPSLKPDASIVQFRNGLPRWR